MPPSKTMAIVELARAGALLLPLRPARAKPVAKSTGAPARLLNWRHWNQAAAWGCGRHGWPLRHLVEEMKRRVTAFKLSGPMKPCRLPQGAGNLAARVIGGTSRRRNDARRL